jgi:hypothetical protein
MIVCSLMTMSVVSAFGRDTREAMAVASVSRMILISRILRSQLMRTRGRAGVEEMCLVHTRRHTTHPQRGRPYPDPLERISSPLSRVTASSQRRGTLIERIGALARWWWRVGR